MKKALFFLAFSLAATFTIQAENSKGNPPQAVRTAFAQKFPGITDVDWNREKNGDWEAEFEQNDTEMSANFSAAGQWLETETEINAADLPASVRAALQGKKIKEAARILRADGSTIYEAEVRGKDLLFDAAGNPLPSSH